MENSLIITLCVVYLAVFSRHTYVNGDTLFTSNGTHILKISTVDNEITVFLQKGLRHVVGLAIDVREDILFFSDVARKHERIGRANLQTSVVRTLVTDVGIVNCLTVDWVSKLLYWTDEARLTIEVIDYEGRYRKVIIDSNLLLPRGITIDPSTGTLFWADQGTRFIESSSMSGTNRRRIVTRGVRWPNQLSFEPTHNRLYWVDGFYKQINSIETPSLTRVKNHRQFASTSFLRNPLFGLIVVGYKAYFTAWDGHLYSTNIAQDIATRRSQVVEQLSVRYVFNIAVKDESLQPTSTHVCGQPSRGLCDQLCLITGPWTHQCACATFGGRMLAPDSISCEEPRDWLLVADCLAGVVRLLRSDTRDNNTYLVARSRCPLAVAYDPVDRRVLWSDTREKAIYSVGMDGRGQTTVLGASDGLDRVDGLAVDWQHRRLYFTSCGCAGPKRDGNVYDWQAVESVDLTGSNRRIVTTAIRQPTSLALDLINSYIYVFEASGPGTLWRCQFDGHHLVQIKRAAGSDAKAWLTISGDIVYVGRATTDSPTHVYNLHYNTTSGTWHDQTRLGLQDNVKVECIAADTNVVFWADTSLTSAKTVLRTEGMILYSNLRSCTSIVHVTQKQQSIREENDACIDNLCSHICVPTPHSHPRAVNYACMCPDASFLTLGNTATTCSEPKTYALIADMNTIKLINLDAGAQDQRVYTLIYGPTKAHYVGLCIDQSAGRIYYSDLSSNSILTADLRKRNSSVFHRSNVTVTSLKLGGHRLYWTCYDTSTLVGSIMSRFIKGTNEPAQVVATNLYQPRAIALQIDGDGRGHIYWTEYGQGGVSGVPPRVRSMTTPSGDVAVLKLPGRSSWPNGLAVLGQSLYFADGYTRVIERMDFGDKQWKPVTLTDHVIDHVYGLTVERGGLLFYTSWFPPRVVLGSVENGQVVVLGDNRTNIFQPGEIVVHL